MMQAFWSGELTNPILSIHDVLKDNGYNEAKIRPLQYLFAVSFFGIRVFVVPLTLYIIFNTNVHLGLKLPTATLCKFQKY
jgi:hypothetical protein